MKGKNPDRGVTTHDLDDEIFAHDGAPYKLTPAMPLIFPGSYLSQRVPDQHVFAPSYTSMSAFFVGLGRLGKTNNRIRKYIPAHNMRPNTHIPLTLHDISP